MQGSLQNYIHWLVVVAVQTYINGSNISKTRINPEHRCIADFIFRTASVSVKRVQHRFWSVVKSRKHVLSRFLTAFMTSQPFFDPHSLYIAFQTPPFLTPSSPPLLPSTTMVFHRWPFIDKGLVENFQGLYERSMRMEPRCKEVRFIWGHVGQCSS